MKEKESRREEAESDEALVAAVLSGDDDLFGLLVRRYQTRVHAHVARMIGHREDALDLTQEYKFSTWLFRIAGNAAIDHLRKKRPKTVPLEVPDPEGAGRVSSGEYSSADLDPYGMLRNVERGEAIRRAIEELPEDFRELIALRYVAGLSYEEIATVKDMPLGTVKNKLFRARAVLKERLAGEFS